MKYWLKLRPLFDCSNVTCQWLFNLLHKDISSSVLIIHDLHKKWLIDCFQIFSKWWTSNFRKNHRNKLIESIVFWLFWISSYRKLQNLIFIFGNFISNSVFFMNRIWINNSLFPTFSCKYRIKQLSVCIRPKRNVLCCKCRGHFWKVRF